MGRFAGILLAKGRVIFRGTPAELTGAAAGHVWTVMADRPVEPEPGWTIVSMLHLSDSIQYRLMGPAAASGAGAEPARPSLEDGVWLMKQESAPRVPGPR